MAKNQVNRSDSEWEEIIRECKTSGMSDHQWCMEHGISVSTFYRRLRWYRNVQPVNYLPSMTKPAKPDHHAIVPLTILEDSSDHPGAGFACTPAASIRVHGITIDLYQGAGPDMVQNLLQMAVELC